jgi:hypothetical protein
LAFGAPVFAPGALREAGEDALGPRREVDPAGLAEGIHFGPAPACGGKALCQLHGIGTGPERRDAQPADPGEGGIDGEAGEQAEQRVGIVGDRAAQTLRIGIGAGQERMPAQRPEPDGRHRAGRVTGDGEPHVAPVGAFGGGKAGILARVLAGGAGEEGHPVVVIPVRKRRSDADPRQSRGGCGRIGLHEGGLS